MIRLHADNPRDVVGRNADWRIERHWDFLPDAFCTMADNAAILWTGAEFDISWPEGAFLAAFVWGDQMISVQSDLQYRVDAHIHVSFPFRFDKRLIGGTVMNVISQLYRAVNKRL